MTVDAYPIGSPGPYFWCLNLFVLLIIFFSFLVFRVVLSYVLLNLSCHWAFGRLHLLNLLTLVFCWFLPIDGDLVQNMHT